MQNTTKKAVIQVCTNAYSYKAGQQCVYNVKQAALRTPKKAAQNCIF